MHGITRKDGSYGKILSDAFVKAVDGKTRLGVNKAENESAVLKENVTGIFEEILDRMLEEKFYEMLPKLQEIFAEQTSKVFREYVSDFHSDVDAFADKVDTDGMGQMQEAELSEDMMAFAFVMGE